jgi:hypothetical protein
LPSFCSLSFSLCTRCHPVELGSRCSMPVAIFRLLDLARTLSLTSYWPVQGSNITSDFLRPVLTKSSLCTPVSSRWSVPQHGQCARNRRSPFFFRRGGNRTRHCIRGTHSLALVKSKSLVQAGDNKQRNDACPHQRNDACPHNYL